MTDWRSVKAAVSLISGKWTLPVLAALADGSKRHNELARAVGVDNKTLARVLQRLLAEGLVVREVVSSQRVTYRLSPHGRTLDAMMQDIGAWWLCRPPAAPPGRPLARPGPHSPRQAAARPRPWHEMADNVAGVRPRAARSIR